MTPSRHFQAVLAESIAVKQAVMEDAALLGRLEEVAETMAEAFRTGNKVLFCGNGGSAADAQHIAAELSGRFYYDRPPLFAEALHVNSSFVTAVANDYAFEQVYARAVEAMGRPGDVLVGISTSGNSPNVIRAVEKAKDLGMKTVAMTGSSGGKLAQLCEILLNVPSDSTPRIQEVHILMGHLLCESVEAALFPQK